MSNTDNKQIWKKYRERELAEILPILKKLGFKLDREQPHLEGEKYLMRAVTTASGKKLILLGRREQDGKRVIIKATSDKNGIREIEHERICRDMLQKIGFAYQTFFSPRELLFTKQEKFTISAQEFLKQEIPFTERPLREQFSLALKAFKAQESAHAATYGHGKIITKTFGRVNAKWYLNSYQTFQENIKKCLPEDKHIQVLLRKGNELLLEHKQTIEQYGGFLTHTDFVPHNFRIIGNDIYLLDYSSLRFGNKHEGWARFLNFMALYNQPLEEAFLLYVKNNRAEEEYLSLKLMRVYRLGEIIWFYTSLLKKTSGDLHTLTKLRVKLWTLILEAALGNKQISKEIIDKYKCERDNLRSEEEKKRQINLH